MQPIHPPSAKGPPALLHLAPFGDALINKRNGISEMFDPREKIALFIDGANLYATAKSLGFDIDYKRLLVEFQSKGYLLRAYYYTALAEDQEYLSLIHI